MFQSVSLFYTQKSPYLFSVISLLLSNKQLGPSIIRGVTSGANMASLPEEILHKA